MHRGKAMQGRSEKGAIHKPGQAASTETTPASTLILDFELNRKLNFCCLNCTGCGTLSQQPQPTITIVYPPSYSRYRNGHHSRMFSLCSQPPSLTPVTGNHLISVPIISPFQKVRQMESHRMEPFESGFFHLAMLCFEIHPCCCVDKRCF